MSGTLLKEEPCYKFKVKLHVKNYFRQFVSGEIQHVQTWGNL